MKDFRQSFKDKKITVMGLGLLGRGVGDAAFLAECGAILTVTDLKPRAMLQPSLKKLQKYKNIKYVLGKHRLEDFRDRDMIIKSAGVPLDSIYIKEAQENKIPIEMDVSLFIKCAPETIVVGITGTRGKSMATALIYEILSSFFAKAMKGQEKRNVFLGGNVRGVATLPLLEKVQAGDILVCELDSWQLQGFGDNKISPHISVFTSFMPDHMNYYKNNLKDYFNDKANIFKFQKKDDVLIIRPDMKKLIPKNIKSKLIVVSPRQGGASKNNVEDFKFIVPGEHQKENLACAVEVAKQFNIPIEKIKKAVANFKGLEGRLQLLKTIKGVKIYNDNNATTPEATIAGIEALKNDQKNIILICGGADKKLDLANFVEVLNKYCKAVVMIPGTGTDKLVSSGKILVTSKNVKDLKEAVKESLKLAQKNNVILFSPAFASFSQFNNEYERNDLFVEIIKGLK